MKTTTTNLLKAILVGACVVQFASVAAGQTVPADIDISPSVLNLGSAGSMIGCSVRLPQAYSATDIDVGSIRLNGQLIVVQSSNTNENVLSAKFRRSDVQDILGPVGSGEVEIRISGQLADGTEFAGTDTITITHGTHTLTPSAGPHGSISPSEPMTVLYGDSQAFTATPDTGYEVDAWSLDGSIVQTGGTTYTASNVQADHTVGVTFKRLPYRLTPSAGPHGSISPAEPVTVLYGDSQAFTATPDTGYEVDAWSLDGSVVQTGGTTHTVSSVQADHTVGVTFKRLPYQLTPSAGPNGSISPAEPVTVLYGDSQAFTATPDTGYQVDTWSVDGSVVQTGGTTYTASNVGADHTVGVTFKRLPYQLTPSAGPNGSISPSQVVTVLYGDSQAFTATPDTGYEVDTWSVDGSVVQTGGTTYTVSDVGADHTVGVTFKRLPYQLTPSAGPNGAISPSQVVTVLYGDSQAFTATPDTGYQVDTWSVDGSVVQTGGTTYTVSDVGADHTVGVSFKRLQYQITPSAGPNGSIDPSTPLLVEPGSDLKLTADPATGYKVDTWSLDDNVAQIGGNEYELVDIDADHTVHVTFVPLLSYSLGDLEFEGAEDFLTKIVTNNAVDPGQPENERIHVERVEGFDPNPAGVMVMHSRVNWDPTSPGFGLLVNARAKASFDGAYEDEIVIRFTYMFSTGGPGVELVVYLSDVPALLDRDDPQWDEHYIEVARLQAPPVGRPGSPGSGRVAVFEKLVWTGHLNLAGGTWIELELIEPEVSNSVAIDAWGSAVQCYGICLDINWDNLIDVTDFLKVIGECGRPAVGERACCEGVFSGDGVVDSLDTVSWDWALNSSDRLSNLCRVPLVCPTGGVGVASHLSFSAASAPRVHLASLPYELSDLLIMGKRGTSVPSNKLKDRLYIFDQDGVHIDASTPSPDRGNIRLVEGNAGELYVVNSERGLVQLDETDESIIPPDAYALTDIAEPRYSGPATVYVGIQDEGPEVFGRPILDAALDGDYVYVVPVVVSPIGGEPYTAAAKLLPQGGGGSPYQVVQLYDDPPLAGDNQYRDALRELEIDDAGNLYVLNAHTANESDILWRYGPDGTMERLDLGNPDSDNYCPFPAAMHMSGATDMLYVASGQQDEDDFNTSLIHGYSTQGALAHARLIEIADMQHIADIAEDPATGNLWVLGFSMYYVPEYPNPTVQPFYYPCLASVGPDEDRARAQSLYDPGAHDLALPLSIVWTGM